MGLKEELGLKRNFTNPAHEALLNIYHTGAILKKRSREFFSEYGITDVQFNVLALLCHQSSDNEGVTQAQLSQMMLVNRANVTSIIDRMEKADLVARTPVPGDRRCNAIQLTAKGLGIFKEVEEKYDRNVLEIMSVLFDEEVSQLVGMLERVRNNL
ncbi:MarR family winged helix-turn-helix transcriptional regulator [Candidatus Hydrogenedentota bacterium]